MHGLVFFSVLCESVSAHNLGEPTDQPASKFEVKVIARLIYMLLMSSPLCVFTGGEKTSLFFGVTGTQQWMG